MLLQAMSHKLLSKTELQNVTNHSVIYNLMLAAGMASDLYTLLQQFKTSASGGPVLNIEQFWIQIIVKKSRLVKQKSWNY